jgi:hypothetical protein
MPNTFLKSIQVFISSPSDVKSERECAVRTLERLNRMSHIRSRFRFVPAIYETGAPPMVGKAPQQVIKEYMLRPNQADLFICILWQRMGTPLKDDASGKEFRSGTEYEFSSAYRANQESGAPFILLYRCARAAEGSVDAEQNRAVQDFFRKFTSPESVWKGLFKTYQTIQEFEDQLFQDLDHVISNNLLRALQSAVSVQGDLCNDGWLITFLISEPVREIFYAVGRSRPFKSTGHQSIRDTQTGSPMAHFQITLPLRRGKHLFRVKYLDINGETKGPFDLALDTQAERLRNAKQTLEHFDTQWIEFRRFDDELLAYFGSLLNHKDVICRIEYSIDDESLRRTLRFKSWKGSGPPEAVETDQDPVTVPRHTKFVAVQVTYSDNSKSEMKKFTSRGARRG